MKRFAALVLVCAIPLAACQQSSEQSGQTALEAKPGVNLGKGRLVLNAIKEHPSSGYFTLVNNSDQPIILKAVHIEGAEWSEMHSNMASKHGVMTPLQDLTVEAGKPAVFAPGGYHVMAFDLDPRLVAGGTTEITLTFADGDKISAPLEIKAPGDTGHGDGH